jgi:predicted N-acetyltransferase YhbS
MQFERLKSDKRKDLSNLFRSTFCDSEGEAEGLLIGDLADKLSAAIDDRDVISVGAIQGEVLIGAIFLTRLRFADNALVYMLAPVAVSTAHQGTGVGQALIRFGLNALAGQGAAVAITYGDPAYYGRLGFEPLSEGVIRAPVALSMPHGWLGQSLNGHPIQPRQERPQCVEAFRNAAYW